MADEIDGPHRLPQPQQRRAPVPGRRAIITADGINLDAGDRATLLAIRWDRIGYPGGWVFYIDTDPTRAVFVADPDLGPFLHALGE